MRHALLGQGLQVRDCSSFGLPEHVRVAVRLSEECRRLVSTLRSLAGVHPEIDGGEESW